MKVYIYCLEKEKSSCKKLGTARVQVLKYAKNRYLDIVGISSVNAILNTSIKYVIDCAIDKNADALLINGMNYIPKNEKQYLKRQCLLHNLKIINITRERSLHNGII